MRVFDEHRRNLRLLATLAISLGVTLFGGAAQAAEPRLRLATTTSTENSGLLAYLIPPFEEQCRCKVGVIAVGTGKALKLGEQGDVDLVLVHARTLEDKFVADGWGVNRRDVMYNDFVLVGPKSDPAKVKSATNAREAFLKIAKAGAQFISRGDQSGTHEKELEIWKRVDTKRDPKWYVEAGQGMSEVLTMASEREAYTLSDRATYWSHPRRKTLEVLYQGDPSLYNPYGIIAVNPKRHPSVDHARAMQFIEFITGTEGKRLITSFKVGGEQLFFLPPGR